MSADAPAEETTSRPKGPRRTFARFALRPLRFGLLCYLLCLVMLTYWQRSLIYHPHQTNRLLASKSGLDQPIVDVTVKSHDGLELHGWLVLSGDSSVTDASDVKRVLGTDRPVVVFFPGNAGDRSMRYEQIATLRSLNAHVLFVDYRGYADNAGKPSEANFARDARSVWNYLTQELEVLPHRVVIYGESLGGGSAIRLASELCQAGIEPGGLIAQSTFSSLVAAAQYHFPLVPASLVLVDRFPSDLRIPHVTCPILQIHGQQDTIVPFTIGQNLFAAAPEKSSRGVPKKLLALPNVDHNDVYFEPTNHHALVTELARFLEEVAIASTIDRSPNRPPHLADTATGLVIEGWATITTALILALAMMVWWLFRVNPPPKP